jgi:small subunit ribosomal protein S12
MVYFNFVTHPKKRRAHKSKAPALLNCPQKKAIVIKSFETTPRKPNSAKRRVAKVSFSNFKKVNVYLEGIGTNKLSPHSVVLVRGGRVPDLPGVHYHAVRGKIDFSSKETFDRRKRRSKFGIPLPKDKQKIS